MSMKFMQKARGIDPRQAEEELSKPVVTDEHWSLKEASNVPSNRSACKFEYESSYGSLISAAEDNGETQGTVEPVVAGRASFGLFNKELEDTKKESAEEDENVDEPESDAPYKMEGLETTERERRNQERLSKMIRGKANTPSKSHNDSSKKRKATDMDRDIISLDTEKNDAPAKPKKKKNKNKKKKN
ncbi:M-phase phosphoprotein 6 family protein [Schizosaccharomyces cryophilus OY26]|uniref:M-phase phosphoprotein 6 family protein n=1 Tax=Schizosaccharomyces cryophilus (strain OY26 / ATCC MYA-4695 / CBS 11777 / NBRC 106824 / NRRL Y48691) TaxID=653667 RepID=S9W002_SCHCR|nr:M-phase phosphoprotein 6 family protein [Schizosaccharomyces cryophilus OY26]EPY53273.1 M-phase phosphoprotein 6 family protein [Schizosaccharomyces cryophilus OY26]